MIPFPLRYFSIASIFLRKITTSTHLLVACTVYVSSSVEWVTYTVLCETECYLQTGRGNYTDQCGLDQQDHASSLPEVGLTSNHREGGEWIINLLLYIYLQKIYKLLTSMLGVCVTLTQTTSSLPPPSSVQE